MRTKFAIGAIACVLLTGCGGTGGGPIPVGPTVTLTPVPPVVQSPGTANSAAPLSTLPQQLTVTEPSGQQIQVTVPAGITVTKGEEISVIKAQLPLPASGAGTAHAVGARQAGGGSQFYINGTPSSLYLAGNGTFVDQNNNVIANFTLGGLSGSINVVTITVANVTFGSGATTLPVAKLTLKTLLVQVTGHGVDLVADTTPTGISGTIPAIGGTQAGAKCTATFGDGVPHSGTLTLTWGATPPATGEITKSQTSPLTNGDQITFYDPNNDNGDRIPPAGVDTMFVDFSQ